ncbi:AbiH family protein [Lacrimispora sp. 38-1]
MKMKILFIIGNGFDIHHKLKTEYYHFRDYIKNLL